MTSGLESPEIFGILPVPLGNQFPRQWPLQGEREGPQRPHSRKRSRIHCVSCGISGQLCSLSWSLFPRL